LPTQKLKRNRSTGERHWVFKFKRNTIQDPPGHFSKSEKQVQILGVAWNCFFSLAPDSLTIWFLRVIAYALGKILTCRYCQEDFVKRPGKPGFLDECPKCLAGRSIAPDPLIGLSAAKENGLTNKPTDSTSTVRPGMNI
jgi:hypothetical protein